MLERTGLGGRADRALFSQGSVATLAYVPGRLFWLEMGRQRRGRCGEHPANDLGGVVDLVADVVGYFTG